ncbi:hypothetical protein PYW08_015563 [Mythimna loreyi]|uniref:Uncharacterized protein n=1 Tax=Mythimna loreyi TaxID=667449 RepID=A0ACC2R083_9NEOP|nr:hypothetical protein PYW08_015563 [Mythimna loreyi]
MPRKCLRKTERAQTNISQYEDAYEEVKRGTSVRSAVELHQINCMSLLRYLRKRDEAGTDHVGSQITIEKTIVIVIVFSMEQEQQLSKYITRCADIWMLT